MTLHIDDQTAVGGGRKQNDPYATRFFDGILYIMATDSSRYWHGEPVRILLVKVNITFSPVILNYRTGQRFDFIAFQEEREVWRWSATQAFSQVAARVILQPGEAQRFNVTWDQRDNAGRLIEPGFVTIRGYNMAEELRYRYSSCKTSSSSYPCARAGSNSGTGCLPSW